MLMIVAYCRQYVQKTTRRMIVQAALQSCNHVLYLILSVMQ